VRACADADWVERIIVAGPPGQQERAGELAAGAAGETPFEVVPGGEHRSESVALALARVQTELVVVHDAARPLVTPELIDACLAALAEDADADAVVAATPVTDTIKQILRGMEVERTLDRSSLWAAQTPQAFRVEALRRALASTELLAQATDDAMLIERIGGKVLLHEASPENIKVTTPRDIQIAEFLLTTERE
jgi:2-C-methyl-D-erythritol 4-phosphate cytidylyltransferase